MADFLWKKVSEKEKEKIKKEAKKIMDNFSEALKKVESEVKEEGSVIREFQIREEKPEKKRKDKKKDSEDVAFKKLFFKNSPKKEGNWIKAEKGKWK